jgi:hypothetical protein
MLGSVNINLSNLSKHFALITVACSIFVFLSSYIYTIFFFKNIDIPYNTLVIPITFFLRPIILSVLIIVGTLGYTYLYCSKFIHDPDKLIDEKYYQTIGVFFISIILLFITVFWFANNPVLTFDEIKILFGFLFLIATFLIGIPKLLPKKNNYRIKYKLFFIKNNLYTILFFIILLVIFYFQTLADLGTSDSEDLIKGRPGSYEVILDFVEPNSDLENKTLILLMQYGGNSYLVEKCDPNISHNTAEVYMIPDHSIKSITIRKIPSPNSNSYDVRNINGVIRIVRRWW